MMINKKSKKGITLISMILTVIVLLIILGAIVYSSQSSFQMKKLESLYSDIDSLKDAISVYYVKTGTLPVYYSEFDIYGQKVGYQEIELSNSNGNTYLNIPQNDYDDLNSYYIIDITKLNNISLNNKNNIPDEIDSGKYSPNLAEYISSSEINKAVNQPELIKSIDEGVFIVNSKTHIVYYTKGVTVDGTTYYTKNEDYSKIPTFSKTDKTSVEDQILSLDENVQPDNDDNITIIFYANGGVNAPNNMIVDKNPEFAAADSLIYHLEGGLSHLGIGTPSKTGMNFLGWSTNPSAKLPEYVYELANHDGKTYVEYTKSTEIKNEDGNTVPVEDIVLSQYSSDIIELYAVWEIDSDSVLYYYYPNSTGGIKPEDYNTNIITRLGKAEAVSNYLCVDIPSSGYEVSWKWEEGSSYEQQAQYVGRLPKEGESEITSSSEITGTFDIPNTSDPDNIVTYNTTEPGTIQIKGSFSELQIRLSSTKDEESGEISDGDLIGLKLKTSEAIKTVEMFKITTDFPVVAKPKNSFTLKVADWLTGEDGKMTIPMNPVTYNDLGIVDPSGQNVYAQENNSLYYLKSAIVFDTINDVNLLDGTVDYISKTQKLGDVIEITSENIGLYPCFGARNYSLTNKINGETTGTIYYHESLQEAYNQAYELKYNTITMLRNTNREGNQEIDEKTYIAHANGGNSYDPTYSKICNFDSKSLDFKLTLNCSNYTMTRRGSLNLSEYMNLIVATGLDSDETSNYSGIVFDQNTGDTTNNLKSAIYLKNNASLCIKEGAFIESNNGTVVGLEATGNLYLYKGVIKNTSIDPQKTTAVYSDSSSSYICLGIEKDVNELNRGTKLEDEESVISTIHGLAINTKGAIYWKSGTLRTLDIANKSCYNDLNSDGTEKNIYASNDTEINEEQVACLYYDDLTGIISAKLASKNWEFSDKDSGSIRKYYAKNLFNAHACINLINNTECNSAEYQQGMRKIKWLRPKADSGEENSVTITKYGITIDFNSFYLSEPVYTTSQLTVNTGYISGNELYERDMAGTAEYYYFGRTWITNLNCETQKGISINNSLVELRKVNVGVSEDADSSINAVSVKRGEIHCVAIDDFKIYTKNSGYAISNENGIVNILQAGYDVEIFTEGTNKAIYNTGKNAKFIIGNKTDGGDGKFDIYSKNSSTTNYVIENRDGAILNLLGNKLTIESKNKQRAIKNSAICEIDSSKIKSNATTSVYAIENTGTLSIYNSNCSDSDYDSGEDGYPLIEASYGLQNSGTVAKLYVYDNSVIKAENRGITTINSAETYIFSKKMEDASFQTNTESVYAPSIEVSGKNGMGVYVHSGGKVTMGSAEKDNISVNVELPVIKSVATGVYITSTGTFNYYDGIIYGYNNGSAIITSNDKNAIVQRSGGKLRKISGYTINRYRDQTIGIGGITRYQLQKIVLTPNPNYLDNLGTYYATLAEAITAANNDASITAITVQKNTTESAEITYNGNQSLTLDLNEKKITFNSGTLTNNGNLSVIGSGTIAKSNEQEVINNTKILIVKDTTINGQITSSGSNLDIENSNIETSESAFALSANNGTINIDNSKLLSVKQNAINITSGSVVLNITSSEIVTEFYADVYAIHAPNAQITIIGHKGDNNNSIITGGSGIYTKKDMIILGNTTVEAEWGTAITIEGAKLTIGEKDKIVNDSPKIIGNRGCIYIADEYDYIRRLQFYDGIAMISPDGELQSNWLIYGGTNYVNDFWDGKSGVNGVDDVDCFTTEVAYIDENGNQIGESDTIGVTEDDYTIERVMNDEIIYLTIVKK